MCSRPLAIHCHLRPQGQSWRPSTARRPSLSCDGLSEDPSSPLPCPKGQPLGDYTDTAATRSPMRAWGPTCWTTQRRQGPGKRCLLSHHPRTPTFKLGPGWPFPCSH